MDELSLAAVAAISAVVASAIGGLLALGGVVVQERLATRRQIRQSALEEARDAARRKLERELAILLDTRQATDEIYALISAWGFATDPVLLRNAQLGFGPSNHPRADWAYVDDASMIEMLEVTLAIFGAGRASSSWEHDAPRLLAAYQGVIHALLGQEERLQDGAIDVRAMSDEGGEAFNQWITIVEQMRMVN